MEKKALHWNTLYKTRWIKVTVSILHVVGNVFAKPILSRSTISICSEAFKEAQSEFLLTSSVRALNWKQIPDMTYDEVAHVIGENLA